MPLMQELENVRRAQLCEPFCQSTCCPLQLKTQHGVTDSEAKVMLSDNFLQHRVRLGVALPIPYANTELSRR